MTSSLNDIRAYLITNNKDFHKSFEQNWKKNQKALDNVLKEKEKLSDSHLSLLNRIKQVRQVFIEFPDQMFVFREGANWDVAKLRMDKWVAPLEDKIKHTIAAIVELQTSDMESSFFWIEEEFNSLIIVGVFLLFTSIFICILLVLLTIKIIIGPIKKVVNMADTIASGDFSEDIVISGSTEIENLGRSLGNMTGVLRKIANHADRVAKGEYSFIYEPQSDKDILGISLRSMTENLKDATQMAEQENWLKSGQAEFSDLLRGLESENEIARASIGFISKYLGTFVGAIYLRKERNLHYIAGYAVREDSEIPKKLSIGEGIPGRAVLERTTSHISDLPEDFFNYSINSGVGKTNPTTLISVPILNPLAEKNIALGVFVLGAQRPFSEVEVELLEKLAGTIAASIESVLSQNRLRELLEEYQQQAEELQAQQEELKSANEELAEQAEALRSSEEELTIQGKKMKQNNELLELQKKEQEDKNKLLEEAKNIIEAKAHDLESASKYKSEFLANMSHELRTPLNSLLILSESLSINRSGNLTESQVEDARVIYEGGLALLQLINDILDLSKVEAGKLTIHQEDCDINYLSARVKDQFQPIADLQNVRFNISLSKDISKKFQTDVQRLEQIIRNFLSNAFKFTSSGEVSLSIKPIESCKSSVVESSPLDSGIAFIVKDTGIGISSSQQEEIFEAFHQGDGSSSRSYGGTGLGLTISRELAKLLGGKILLESKV
ncbi:MAG: ATP-binding protein, partial [Kangiellaceae bacterium]|nr:ATP-binding protein [Kangiellaceae bacterium]